MLLVGLPALTSLLFCPSGKASVLALLGGERSRLVSLVCHGCDQDCRWYSSRVGSGHGQRAGRATAGSREAWAWGGESAKGGQTGSRKDEGGGWHYIFGKGGCSVCLTPASGSLIHPSRCRTAGPASRRPSHLSASGPAAAPSLDPRSPFVLQSHDAPRPPPSRDQGSSCGICGKFFRSVFLRLPCFPSHFVPAAPGGLSATVSAFYAPVAPVHAKAIREAMIAACRRTMRRPGLLPVSSRQLRIGSALILNSPLRDADSKPP